MVVVADGFIYQLRPSGEILRYSGPSAVPVVIDDNPNTVAIAANGRKLYQLHRDGSIWEFSGVPLTGWTMLDSNTNTVTIAAGGDKLYQIHRDGSIWEYSGIPLTGWIKLDGNPNTVAIAAGGDKLYQVHRDGSIWVYSGTPLVGWTILDSNPNTVAIAAGGDRLWQLHQSGRIFEYAGVPLAGWREVDNNPETAAIFTVGTALFQRHQHGQNFRFLGTPMTGWQPIDGDAQMVGAAAKECAATVYVQVYRIGGVAPLWHTGIEIAGTEYYFYDGNSVRTCPPRKMKRSRVTPHRTIAVQVVGTWDEVEVVRSRVANEWHDTRYDLFDHNCNYFVNDMLLALSAR